MSVFDRLRRRRRRREGGRGTAGLDDPGQGFVHRLVVEQLLRLKPHEDERNESDPEHGGRDGPSRMAENEPSEARSTRRGNRAATCRCLLHEIARHA